MMIFCVILISVVFWTLAPVESRFFLEIVSPITDITELIEKSKRSVSGKSGYESGPKGEDEGYTVRLYECKPRPYLVVENLDEHMMQVWCHPISERADKEKIYEFVNFNSVSNLKLSDGHSFKIEGEFIFFEIPQALTIGMEPAYDFYLKDYTPALTDANYAEKVHKFIGRFTDAIKTPSVPNMLHFFTINHNGYFMQRNADNDEPLKRYVYMLQKIIEAAGYNTEPVFPIRPPPERKPPHRGRFSSLSLFRALSWSPCRRSPKSRRQSKIVPVPQSPPRFQPLTKLEKLQAAWLLSFKMFNPCYPLVLLQIGTETAFEYCTIYCQFISATQRVYGKRISRECENLRTGKCKDGQCVCEDSTLRTVVKMTKCNNALRLHVYKQAGVKDLPVLGRTEA